MEGFIELFTQSETWISLLTLTAMEIVLGVDNIIFISILAGRLPKDQQAKARTIGLLIAVVTRLMLLMAISWVASLTAPLLSIFSFDLSGRDLILLGGGLFLIAKATLEIHHKLEGEDATDTAKGGASFASVVGQIVLLDIVFSLDSVITAVGLVRQISIMVIAILLSLVVMLSSAGAISDFVHRHPTVKMLALSFLVLIGTVLVAEGSHFHVPKGYVYFAMAFSVAVELLNLKLRSRSSAPVQLKSGY